MAETVFLPLLILVAVVWYYQMRARERSLQLARRVCDDMACHLLDDTVAICYMSLKRSPAGRLCMRRIYTFEFTDQTLWRRQGTIVYLGDHLETLLLGDSPVIPS
ncbi:MAG: DUF3301 domain-containing protein [Magnetococcales bacterium]|nr:DUF3301 domain-containing protein [Magnetococcales bacterium]